MTNIKDVKLPGGDPFEFLQTTTVNGRIRHHAYVNVEFDPDDQDHSYVPTVILAGYQQRGALPDETLLVYLSPEQALRIAQGLIQAVDRAMEWNKSNQSPPDA